MAIAGNAGLKERLRAELEAARRQRDRSLVMLLSMTLAELRNREIELGRDAADEDVLDVLQRAVRRRHEAAEQMRAGGRAELADREESEARLLEAYLPARLSEAEVRAIVQDAVERGATTVGAAMAEVMPRIKGRFDGREANRLVREALADVP
jgi:uncharacterized protein